MATSATNDPTLADNGIIFVSYRRTDAGWPADLVARELATTFGPHRVFLDVRELDAGDDFGAQLDDHLQRARALVVLVGANWLHAHDAYGRRRLDLADDWVRREIRAALSNERCRVIPVLLDDASLPPPDVLPSDISALPGRQAIRVRAASSDVDIEILRRALEQQGFRRVHAAEGRLPRADDFTDPVVREVIDHLEALHERDGADLLPGTELLSELDHLFDRKTFRFESQRECSEQRWGDRLHSAYQTLAVLRAYMRNVKATAPAKYAIYRDMVDDVEGYVMQMGQLLFDPPVDPGKIETHVGTPSFEAQLPPPIRFKTRRDKQPLIPDAINGPIERHRVRAIQLMDELTRE
jgi:hypothetical protein